MNLRLIATAALSISAVFAPATNAADKVKVGFISTLSGPNAAIGIDIRDAFNLFMKMNGGKLGGLPAEVTIVDDQLNPDTGKQLADRLVRRDRVDFLTGIVFSNVMLAAAPVALDAKTFYISANAGPSQFAGEGCNRMLFTASWQNDQNNGAPGILAQQRGYKSVYLIAPNYPAGRDALAGFKGYYKGKISDEVYTKLGQLDYAAEIAQIRAAKPEALFVFLPGGMGINFVKQFVAAGLSKDIPILLAGVTADEDTLAAVGDAMLGVVNTAHWAHDLDNPANKKFVDAFELEYKRLPTLYASQGYDTAQLIDAAVRDVKGKIEDKEAVIKALRAKRFQSVRGDFKWANNNVPIQNYYLRIVGRDNKGRLTNKTLGIAAPNLGDPHAVKCPNKW